MAGLARLLDCRGAKRQAERRRESLVSRLIIIVLTALVAVLLAFRGEPVFASARFLPQTMIAYWIGLFMVVVGLAFAVWARRHPGRNWSGMVTVKEDHELIRTGPYAMVRHPIYTGLLFAILGTAVAIGDWHGLSRSGF